MTLTRISIELEHKQYTEIEEYCLSKGLSISDYFSALHELNTQFKWKENMAAGDRFKEFQDTFEKMGHTDPTLDPRLGFKTPKTPAKEKSYADKESLQEELDLNETSKSKKKKLKQ